MLSPPGCPSADSAAHQTQWHPRLAAAVAGSGRARSLSCLWACRFGSDELHRVEICSPTSRLRPWPAAAASPCLPPLTWLCRRLHVLHETRRHRTHLRDAPQLWSTALRLRPRSASYIWAVSARRSELRRGELPETSCPSPPSRPRSLCLPPAPRWHSRGSSEPPSSAGRCWPASPCPRPRLSLAGGAPWNPDSPANTATNRQCWTSTFNINTDYETSWPTTGVTQTVSPPLVTYRTDGPVADRQRTC